MLTTWFRLPARIAIKAVIILVVLAIGIGCSPCRSYRMCPVSASIKIASDALMGAGFPRTVRMGVGLGVGVGEMSTKVGVVKGAASEPPLNRFAPIGVR